ncbi:glutathione S-transferase T3-like [Juglans regia]|uniref:Glutathione S-transferase T3-like n=1 Tax=Juglans regia TaxID=51240 RepID=A0A6P9F4Z4_JUGRE|nr:glutathione S-transferase T3-like [Juglans regia]
MPSRGGIGKRKPTRVRDEEGGWVSQDSNLVSAWLNTSLDPINRVDQSKHSFWARVHEYYEKNKKLTCCEHSSSSLTNRWSTIQHATNKFCGALAQIEGKSPSGVTEQAKIEQANELYRSNQFATFNFLHCWTILRHHPKWKQTVADGSSVKTKRRSVTPDGHVPEFTFLDEDTISPSIDVNLERPIGKKVEKKRKRQDNSSSNLADLVTEMRDEKKRANAEKGEDRKELICLTK